MINTVKKAFPKPSTFKPGNKKSVIRIIQVLTINVNIPSVSMLIGKVSNNKIGRNSRLTNPRITPANRPASNDLRLIPGI